MSLMDTLGRATGKLKDKGLSAAFAAFLKDKVAPYGELMDLTLDSTAKTIQVLVLPTGETEAVRLTLEGYEFMEKDGRRYLILGPVLASRPWIEALVNDLMDQALDGRKLDITDHQLARILAGIL